VSTLLPGLPRAVLRLHRPALALWTAFVLVTVGCLVLVASASDGARSGLTDCTAPGDGCLADPWAIDYGSLLGTVGGLTSLGVWAVAAWAGGALIGRELESGTARLAWTQGVSPRRWLATGLALPALALTTGSAAVAAVFQWAWSSHQDLTADEWATTGAFAARGPALAAYTLCALALGALTGLLLRRQLPALGASLALTVALGQAMAALRARFWPTATLHDGQHLSPHAWQPSGHGPAYHPASHFWPIHLVETGVVVTLAALATAAAFAVLRRRTA
jgi:hypothetical protein